VQHRLQLRWETFCAEAIPLIEAALGATPLPSLAFNDHTSVALLHPSIAVQNKPFDFDPDFPLVDFDDPHFLAKVEGRAKRSNLTTTEFVSLMKQVWTQRPQVQGWIEQVAEKARVAGASMLSHDDTQTKTRAFYRALGAKIAEFPMNVPTSTFARDGGDAIVQGAPNAMRGGSHLGSVSAAEMIKAGLCDILASDYYYPAMLGAVMRLLDDKVGPLHTIWKLVSENPARASGLGDRGQISLGQRGDLVLLDWPDGGIACVRQTWVAGRCAYAASPV
jgi:alpha-D-ribose 1-methylphosphonate 5-triphosphate diphosphatase